MEFTFSQADNAYTTPAMKLSGDMFLTLTLPTNGRLAIRKLNDKGRWPVVLMSKPADRYEIRIYGQTKNQTIKIQTTHRPSTAELDAI